MFHVLAELIMDHDDAADGDACFSLARHIMKMF